MTRYGNGPLAKRLLALYDALQRRDTSVLQIVEMASSCGINPRHVLDDKFMNRNWEA
ncbi:hypothetical protein [Pseudomonas abietaniphila]